MRLALVAISSAIAVEVAIRLMLFGGFALPASLESRLRHSWRYADPDMDEYWILMDRFTPEAKRSRIFSQDPLLGWTGRDIAPRTYRHVNEPELGERRPVLLYGDSFAQCTTPPADCFQGVLARSELASTHLLLNFGIGGQGLSHAWLLLRETIERFAPRAPIVAFGIFVDDGFDRTLLSRRPHPMARVRLVDGELIVEPPDPAAMAIPPAEASTGIASYAWRRILYGSRLVPDALREHLTGRTARREEKREIAHAILAAMHTRLEELGIEHFAILFHGERALVHPSFSWSEAFLVETLRELEIPYVSSRPALEADRAATERAWKEYFDGTGVQYGHYTALGNEVAFRALLSGIRGEYEP